MVDCFEVSKWLGGGLLLGYIFFCGNLKLLKLLGALFDGIRVVSVV
jgi:uncharacterized membrane protein YgdD (TMEM256/DUF423 family)